MIKHGNRTPGPGQHTAWTITSITRVMLKENNSLKMKLESLSFRDRVGILLGKEAQRHSWAKVNNFIWEISIRIERVE